MFSVQNVLKELIPIFGLKTTAVHSISNTDDRVTKNLYLKCAPNNLIWCENNAHINYLSLFLISKRSNCKVKSVLKRKTFKLSRTVFLNFCDHI